MNGRIDSTPRIYSTIGIDSNIRIDLTIMIDSTPQIIFPLQNIYSFKLRIINIVDVCLFLAHSSCRKFYNTMIIRDPVEVICQPSSSGIQGKYGVELSAVWAGESPKSTNSGASPRTGLLAKFILLRALTSATSPETATKPITPLKQDVEWIFMAKVPLMGASNGSVFLTLFAILGWLGLITSWSQKSAGKMEVLFKLGLWELNLGFVSVELTSLGVALSLSVLLTFRGVKKMCAQLRAMSVMFACGSTVWRGINISCNFTTLAVMSRLIGPMTTGMVGLINNVCVYFLLVVLLGTFGSLLGFPATTNFSKSLHE